VINSKNMSDLIVSTLYLFLPCYVANMAPVVAKKLGLFPSLARPLDGSGSNGAKQIFGVNKTYRGILVGIIAGVLTSFAQLLLLNNSFFASILVFPYTVKNFFLWGILLGGGALGGDLAKSYFKRKRGIAPGNRWLPWDQLDMVFGGIVCGSLLYRFSLMNIIILLIATPFLVLAINFVGYFLKIKENW